VLAIAGPYRDAYLALCVLPMLFGTLRLYLGQMLWLVAWNQAGHLAMIAVLYRLQPDVIDLSHELLLWGIIGFQMLWVAAVAAMIGRLRDQLVQSYKAAGRLAALDSLTDVMNRRAMLEHIAASRQPSTRRAAGGDRRGEPGRISVIALADLDHFKRVNDTYGHDVGDRLLAAFAQALRRTVRTNDAVGRFGGDEFLVHLRVHRVEQAQQVLARIESAVAAIQVDGCPHVTASIGAAVMRDRESAEEALRRADAALYQVKRSGRGRVLFAPEEERDEDFSTALIIPV
jgi:diguanylate cyclase